MGKFEQIYHHHAKSVYRYTLGYVGRREVAEEITGDTFLALFCNLEDLDETQLPGWLITVARNRARDYLRRTARERRYLTTLADPSQAESGPQSRELFDSRGLKPVHRVCLTLKFVEGMTRAEIAGETGLSKTQVKGHLQYSIKLLRKALAGGGAARTLRGSGSARDGDARAGRR